MSDTIQFEISIPTDSDGFVILQCEHCGEYFKCKPSDIKDDAVFHIYCPSCGLVSEHYWTSDVYELANAMVKNYMNDYMYDAIKKIGRSSSSKSFEFIAGEKPRHEYESPIYSSIDALEEKSFACCNRSAKVKSILKMSACYCPFCGVITFEDE